MKELTAHDRYQERQRIAQEQHIQRANMKIYCELCKKVQPVQIDNCIDVKTKKPYQDIVCSVCNLVIASGTDIAPPKREWVGLDGEIPGLGLVTDEFYNGMIIAEDILREKNT